MVAMSKGRPIKFPTNNGGSIFVGSTEASLEKELPAFRTAVRQYNTVVLSTSASAASALSSSGIYTASGNLTSKYKN